MRQLPIPPFFKPALAEDWCFSPNDPDLQTAAYAWVKEHNVHAAARSRLRILLLLVDLQNDFCNPKGALFVGGRDGRGAVNDSIRIAEFTYQNIEIITEIMATADAHGPFHVSFSPFWVWSDGSPVPPNTILTLDDIVSRRARPDPMLFPPLLGATDWLRKHAEYYASRLEEIGEQLVVWNPHCILGSQGQLPVGIVQEAVNFHAYVRKVQPRLILKGRQPHVESYSPFEFIVRDSFDGIDFGEENPGLLEGLAVYDAILLAGEAAGFCVDAAMKSIASKSGLAERTYVMTDCMSPVVIPGGPDFTSRATESLKRAERAGMHLVKSTDPIESWPGMREILRAA